MTFRRGAKNRISVSGWSNKWGRHANSARAGLLGGPWAAGKRRGRRGGGAHGAPGGPGRMTGLGLAVEPLHPITARLGSELRLTDELSLSEGPPADASVLLRTKWQFTDQV